jgi:intracellular multiplication protein IcmC
MRDNKSQSNFILILGLFLLAMTTASSVYAAPNVGTMLQNFSLTVPQLMHLVTALAYVLGIVFIVRGIIELKKVGEARTMMSGDKNILGPIIFIVVGSMMLYLPSSIQVGTSTFWASATPLSYINNSSDPWENIINDAYLIIQLIGTIAFVRGLILLTHLSERGQSGTLARAMAYIIAGILCINLYSFILVVNNTLSLGQS